MARRFLAVGVLGLLVLSSCQTAPLGLRRPAADSVDPKIAALAESDALEALGLYTSHVLLTQQIGRMKVGQEELVDPTPIRFDSFLVTTGLIMTPISGGLVGLSVGGLLDANPKASSRLLGVGAGAAGVIAGTIVFTSNSYGQGGSLGSNEDENSIGFLQKSLRPGHARRVDLARAEFKNAEIQATFVTNLKGIAASLADRTGKLFDLTAMERARIALRAEERLLAAFKAQERWKPGDEIRIDIASLLREFIPDADHKLVALGAFVDGTMANEPYAPNSTAAVAEWMERTEKEIRKIEAGVVEIYRANYASPKADVKAVQKQLDRLSVDLDIFARKLALHAEMARAAAERE